MADYEHISSLQDLVRAHACVVRNADLADRKRQASAGQQLLALLVPVKTINRKGGIVLVEADLPLESLTVDGEPTLARLVLSGVYKSSMSRRQRLEDPDSVPDSLAPQEVDLTVVLTDFLRPALSTSFLWARFNEADFTGEATGFKDPHTGEPLGLYGGRYLDIVEKLEEANQIRMAIAARV